MHGPHSVTGAVVHYVASSLGLEPAGPTQRSLLAGQAAGSSHSSERISRSESSSSSSSRGLAEVPATGTGRHGGAEGAQEEAERPQPIPMPWHGFVAGGVAGMAQVREAVCGA